MTLQEMNEFVRPLDSSAKVVFKDGSWLMKIIAFFLWPFNRRFMADYAITIANRVYIPRTWEGRDLRRLLTHEVSGHVRQCRWCGLGVHPWVGMPLYWTLYLLVLLPLLLAYFRYKFEVLSELKACRYDLLEGISAKIVRERLADFVTRITGKDYLFCWPRPWALWGANRSFDSLLRGFGTAYNA